MQRCATLGRMCGRYASSRKPEDLIEEFEVDRVDVPSPLPDDYNVAPTKDVYAVFDRIPKKEEEALPVRRLATVRWGLVPSWAKDPGIGSRLINARVETLAEKPAFKRAFAKRRCLLPADGYYEWYPTQRKTARGKPVKQPFFIRPRDGGVLAMAGLYEIWRNPEVADPDGRRGQYTRWLDPTVTPGARLSELLVPAAPGRLEAFPVSREVNDVNHNGPSLVEPVDLADDEPEGLFDT